MKKFIVFIFLFFIPINLFAISSDNVDYEVYDYIVEANIDVSGNLNVKEVIGIKGSFNGYIRDLTYKNEGLIEFTGIYDDFKGSSIYNGSNIEVMNVGVVKWSGELSFDVFNRDVTSFNLCSNSKGCYEKSNLSNGVSLKMYNETVDDITYFYIEYLVGNVVVLHEDVVEIYYNFIGDMFDDDINNYKLMVDLPFGSSEMTRVWAHGPMYGNVYLVGSYNGKNYFISEDSGKLRLENDQEDIILDSDNNITYYGAYLNIKDLERNTPVDMRMIYSKDLIMVEHPYLKKSNVSALDNILDIEMERANEVNRRRKIAKIRVTITYALTGVYLLGLLVFSIYIYFKHDKERKSTFNLEYYRDFIDDYDVTVIEYLFDKRITEKAFSTSILNMIYKKNISFQKISDKDYELHRVSDDGLNNEEKLIMQIIFDEAGDGENTSLGKIKKYAKKIKGTTSPFLNKFSKWKSEVKNSAIRENFFEDKSNIKIFGVIYSILCFGIIILHASCDIFNLLTISLIVLTTVFLIYVLMFTKRTVKGVEHYAKWKAFKRFLLDFGRFDEKELPEIVLWERYLVYANIFGIAEKLGKLMKIRFNEMNINTNYNNRDIIFDYMLWTHLNSTINNSISSSISIAHTSVQKAASSTYSSGGGFGGGFSSGGGFGGGGGGGRGF